MRFHRWVRVSNATRRRATTNLLCFEVNTDASPNALSQSAAVTKNTDNETPSTSTSPVEVHDFEREGFDDDNVFLVTFAYEPPVGRGVMLFTAFYDEMFLAA